MKGSETAMKGSETASNVGQSEKFVKSRSWSHFKNERSTVIITLYVTHALYSNVE